MLVAIQDNDEQIISKINVKNKNYIPKSTFHKSSTTLTTTDKECEENPVMN